LSTGTPFRPLSPAVRNHRNAVRLPSESAIELIGAIAAIEKCEIAGTLRALDTAIESSGSQSFYARAGGLLSYGAEENPWFRGTSCTAIDFAGRRQGN
jgi:hypothetical protein